MRHRIGYRLMGIGFILVLLAGVSLAVLQYRKAFTPVTWVTLRADRAGMQLNPGADVKLRGVLVGSVRSLSSVGDGARLRLALDPAQASRIPAAVTARLLPKTLFGERYVALVPPAGGSGTAPAGGPGPALRDGSVIRQDRSTEGVELERVLDEALPLLQAIRPDRLATVLGSLATALDGRGEQVGRDVVRLDSYLAELNKQLPVVAEDVRRLATVVGTYDAALPDLMSILRDVTVTSATISDQRAQLAAFLADTTGAADVARLFLNRHGDQLIQVGDVSRPVLELFAAYAPEYPCLASGLVKLQPRVEDSFRGGRLHITLEVTKDGGKYEPGRDDPVYGARHGLPRPAGPAEPGPAVPDQRRVRLRRRPDLTEATGRRARDVPGGRHHARIAGDGIRGHGRGARPGQAARRGGHRHLAGGGTRHRGPAVGPAAARSGGEPPMRKDTRGPVVKLLVFAAVTVLLTGVLAQALGSLSAGGTTYRARFTDATGLLPGDDVRIAGVRVGQVRHLGVVDNSVAEVTFTVDDDVPLATTVRAKIRYRNIVGQRYITLAEGPGDGRRLPRDGLIPLDQTTPALDLTTVFNGFRPLFTALTPADVNKLSYEIIQVLQGEGGTIAGLLEHTASLTTTLADRDEVIGRVIGNLNRVLATLADRDGELEQTIGQLQQFVSGLSADRGAIGDALASLGQLTGVTADLLRDARPAIASDVASLDTLAGTLNRNAAVIDRTLDTIPDRYAALTRTASYGSWFNFFLCDFDGQVAIPGVGSVNPATFSSSAARCGTGGSL
jgi:phospholipid/cholesterol/gamma-HCH transport system substrate-binding protein